MQTGKLVIRSVLIPRSYDYVGYSAQSTFHMVAPVFIFITETPINVRRNIVIFFEIFWTLKYN